MRRTAVVSGRQPARHTHPPCDGYASAVAAAAVIRTSLCASEAADCGGRIGRGVRHPGGASAGGVLGCRAAAAGCCCGRRRARRGNRATGPVSATEAPDRRRRGRGCSGTAERRS